MKCTAVTTGNIWDIHTFVSISYFNEDPYTLSKNKNKDFLRTSKQFKDFFVFNAIHYFIYNFLV